MTVVEDRIRKVLASQAAAMRVPDASLRERLVQVTELPTSRRGPRLLIAAAAVLLVATGVALAQRRTGDSVANGPTAASPLRFETPTVLLEAASVDVTVAGQTFTPTDDVLVEGDPGTPNEYTTLELTWHQNDIEQRINIYFASDGTNWWANEIRTYDGNKNAEWIERQGEFFKSSLGNAYVGDLDLPNLKIRGMHLEAFRRPSSCDNPTGPLALFANFPKIEAGVGHYGASLAVLDTATCAPVAVSAFTFEYTSDNPAVAAVALRQEIIPNYPPTITRVDIDLVAPGETTIHAVAKDQTGNIVGAADMHVIVGPTDAPGTLDTGPPLPTTVPAASKPLIAELLAGVPLPDGFDPTTIDVGADITDHYQLVAKVAGAVTCSWLDMWFTGSETGDVAAQKAAADALATSRTWTMLLGIQSEGAYADQVWQYADAINGGPGILTGGGPVAPTREIAAKGLGCNN